MEKNIKYKKGGFAAALGMFLGFAREQNYEQIKKLIEKTEEGSGFFWITEPYRQTKYEYECSVNNCINTYTVTVTVDNGNSKIATVYIFAQ